MWSEVLLRRGSSRGQSLPRIGSNVAQSLALQGVRGAKRLFSFDDNGDTVMFAPGEPFYATPGKGKNEIRIAYVLKQEALERAMDLLAKGIAAYNAR